MRFGDAARAGVLIAPVLLAGCKTDETLTGHGAADHTWIVQEWHGTPLWPELSLRFEAGGAVSGTGPCNSFTATQSAPYPWFALSDFVATKATCPAQDTETVLFRALANMTLVEVSGSVLILTDDRGREMSFGAAPDDQ